MTSRELVERDQAEIRRSAEEARRSVLKPVDINRYRDPPPDTPYPLEYAFHLLGDIQSKVVLDFGCGSGENLVPLCQRGAQVIGLDISAALIALADRRLKNAGARAILKVGSAYDTGLPAESLDVIFCVALIHHLDIPVVRDEMYRILAKNGVIILSEPIRFSSIYNRLRNLLPAQAETSDYEHPLTRKELAGFASPFEVEQVRYFRLPTLPLVEKALPPHLINWKRLWKMDRWILRHFRAAATYATTVTMRLRKAS